MLHPLWKKPPAMREAVDGTVAYLWWRSGKDPDQFLKYIVAIFGNGLRGKERIPGILSVNVDMAKECALARREARRILEVHSLFPD